MKISILCPTRNRPHHIQAVYDSGMDTAKNKSDIDFSFYIDNDDTLSESKFNEMNKLNIKVTKGDRICLSVMWNEAYKKAEGEILMHCGDDILFKTKDWDELIINAFNQYEDKIVLVGGNDGSGKEVHDGKFFTHGFIHRNWVNAVGYFVPPYFSSDYNDTWLNDVARLVGRWHYIPELLTEHMHPAWKKRPDDQTDIDRCARHYRDNVRQLYDDLSYKRIEDAVKLQSYILEFNS